MILKVYTIVCVSLYPCGLFVVSHAGVYND